MWLCRRSLAVAALSLFVAADEARPTGESSWNGTWSGVSHIWGEVTVAIDLPWSVQLTIQEHDEILQVSGRGIEITSLALTSEKYKLTLQRSEATSNMAFLTLKGPENRSETINIHLKKTM